MAKTKSFRQNMNSVLTTIKSPTFNVGFSNIDTWVGLGNYAMNRLWSGKFDRGMLFGRNYVFYGESGSGKSLFSAIVAANAQKEHGAFVFWLDTERANDDKAGAEWLTRAGLDLDPDVFEYVTCSTLGDIKTLIAKVSIQYKVMMDKGETPPPIVFVVDSWASAMTDSQWDKAGGKKAGDMTGDMGQKAKQTGDVINAVTHLCGGKPIMVIGVQHVMDNQDMHGGKHKTTGGNKMIYYASGCLLLSKLKLNLEDVEDDEIIDHYDDLDENMSAAAIKEAGAARRQVGITAKMEILKSRVSKPFESVKIQIPFKKGVDPYSGLFNLLQQEGVITVTSPGWYQFLELDGAPVKFQKKNFLKYADRMMEIADEDIHDPEAEKKVDAKVGAEPENEGATDE